MKISITCNNKEYTLAYTRKTAREMGVNAEKIKDTDDLVETANILIKSALKAEQPNITQREAEEVTDYVMENCQLVDDKELGKGLLTYLNEMIEECLPKGFTQKKEKSFTVV